MEEVKCKKCIFYKLHRQPDYLVNGKTINICSVYKEGIPNDIWEGKKECEEYFEEDL